LFIHIGIIVFYVSQSTFVARGEILLGDFCLGLCYFVRIKPEAAMRRFLGGFFTLFLACSSSPTELPGTSVLTPKMSQQKNPAPKAEDADNSVMGNYFHFERPAPNLLFRRGKKQGEEVEDPPPLTGKHVGAVNDLVEFSLEVQLTEAQKNQLRDAVIAEYEAGGERRAGVLSAPLAWVGMEQIYNKAPSQKEKLALIQTNKELFIKGIEASPDFLYKKVVQAIINAQKTVASEGPPVLTQQHVECQLEMIEFLLSIYLQKPFTFSVDDREVVTSELIKAYSNLPSLSRDLFIKNERHPDLLWSVLRYQWTKMEKPERQIFRVALVDLFGQPFLKGDEQNGAKALMLLPDAALSAEMRQLVTPMLGQLLEQIAQITPPLPALVGYVIYDY
jgi:hypothetical protein